MKIMATFAEPGHDALVDLDKGIIGTYVGKMRDGEPGFVKILYKPSAKGFAELLRPKTIEYGLGVKEETEVFIRTFPTQDPGTESKIVFVAREAGSFFKERLRELERKNYALREQVRNLEAENRNLRQEVEDAQAGVSKMEAKRRSMIRKEPSTTPFGGVRNEYDTFREV